MGSYFDSDSVVSSSSLLCLVSLSLGAILWPSRLLSSCVCFLNLNTYGAIDSLGVFPLYLMMVANIIAPKPRIIFFRAIIRLGSFPECWLM